MCIDKPENLYCNMFIALVSFCRETLFFLPLIKGTVIIIFQVLLGEIYTGTSVARVVVKELKASAGLKEQEQFLRSGEPY